MSGAVVLTGLAASAAVLASADLLWLARARAASRQARPAPRDRRGPLLHLVATIGRLSLIHI